MPAKPFMMCITPLRGQKALHTDTDTGRGRTTTQQGNDMEGRERAMA